LLLSGTPWEEINDIKPYWETMRCQARTLRALWEQLGDETSKKKLADTKDDFDQFIRFSLQDEENKERRRKNRKPDSIEDESIQKHSKTFGQCLAIITIRRTTDTRIPEDFPFNSPIVKLPPLRTVQVPVVYDAQTLHACNNNTTQWQKELGGTRGNSKKEVSSKMLLNKFRMEVQTSQSIVSLPTLLAMTDKGSFNNWDHNKGERPGGPIKFTQHRIQVQGFYKEDCSLRNEVADACNDDLKANAMCDIIQDILSGDEKQLRVAERAKIRSLKHFIGEPSDYLEKIVVAAQTTMTAIVLYDILCKQFGDDTVCLLTGLVSILEREKIIENFTDQLEDAKGMDNGQPQRFKHSKRPRVLIADVRVMAVGPNLYRANHILVIEPSGDPSQDAQLKKSAHRIGQIRACFIYNFMVEGMVVEGVMKDR
jgi:SNF2 family DNA or RNA helicase